MKTTQEQLVTDLIERTRQHMNQAETLKTLSNAELNFKSSPESWSVLECIEHLNMYGDYYLPEIEKRLHKNTTNPAINYKAGILGDYFAKMMLPKEKMSKMKTFKDKDPIGSKLDKKTLDRFINQQKKTLELLNKCRKANLEKIRIPISIAKWIKLKLGDTLRVVIYHNQRHLLQAENVLKNGRLAISHS